MKEDLKIYQQYSNRKNIAYNTVIGCLNRIALADNDDELIMLLISLNRYIYDYIVAARNCRSAFRVCQNKGIFNIK